MAKRTLTTRTPSTKRMKTTKRATKSSDAVKRAQIKSVLNGMIEKKHAITEYADVFVNRAIPSGVVLNSGVAGATGNFFKILPEIDQSVTGEAGRAYNTRIGNEITLKEIDIRGHISYANSNAAQTVYQNGKLAVRVMILRAKEVSDQSLLFANMPTDELIRFGNQAAGSANGVGSFGGFSLDSFRDINRDVFSVRHDEVIYLDAPVILPGGTQPDVTVVPSASKLFNHKLRFGANGLKLKYGQQSDVNPNNFPYFMVIGYSSMSSGTQPDNDLVRATISCVGTYTDA